jgi:hypothetical protein
MFRQAVMEYWVRKYIIDTYVCEKCKFNLFIDSPSYIFLFVLAFESRDGKDILMYECMRVDILLIVYLPIKSDIFWADNEAPN